MLRLKRPTLKGIFNLSLFEHLFFLEIILTVKDYICNDSKLQVY